MGKGGGILNAIIGSAYLATGGTLLAMLLSVPIALYLKAYLGKSRWGDYVRLSLDVLWGIPSIVYGAFGFALMILLGMRASLLAGIIVLALVELPIMTRAMDEVIRRMPEDLEHAALALGSTKFEVAINIITRKPDGKAPHSVRALAGTATTGQRNTLILGSSLNFSTGDIQHRLGLESREISPLRYNRGSLADDLSGVSHQSVNYQGLLRLGAHSFGLTLEASRQDDNRDNFATVGTRTVPYEAFEKESRQFAALRYNGEVGPGALEMVGAFSRSDGATNRSGPGTNETTLFKQTQFQARYFLERGQHGLTFGAGADRSDVNIAINSRSATRNVEHVLVQDQWHFDPKWNLVAGVRADHYSDFGSTTNPRVSIARTDGPLTLRAGYGSAFQAPTLVQQYSSFTRGRFIILGTPGLQPEKSRTTELGARYALAAGAVDAVLFRSRVSDRIESYQTGALVGSLLETRYRNISRANLSGGELNLTWQPAAGVALKAGVDLLNARNGDTGARLTGSARQTYRLSARYALGAWSFEGRARHLRDYYQIDPVARGAAYYTRYTVADLRADYTLGARTVLFLGLDNLFDRNVPNNWSGTGGFEDPGKRFGYVGLRHAF